MPTFYFNPETLEAFKNETYSKKFDFLRYECEWEDEEDFQHLLHDFLKQVRELREYGN